MNNQPSALRGSYVILGMLILAAFIGGFAVIYRWNDGNDTLRYWGTERALAIQRAPVVQLLVLGKPGPTGAAEIGNSQPTREAAGDDSPPEPLLETSAETPNSQAAAGGNSNFPLPSAVELAGQAWPVTGARDISGSGGLIHLRHQLLVDHSFAWPEVASPERFAYALRFADPADPSTDIVIGISLDDARLQDSSRTSALDFRPIASFVTELIRRKLPQPVGS